MNMLLLLACAADGAKSPETTDTGAPDQTWAGTLMTSVEIAESAFNPLAGIVTVALSEPATVTAAWDCGGRTGSDSAEMDGGGTLEIWGVRAETDCAVSIAAAPAGGGTTEEAALGWTSGSLPAGLPEFSVEQGAGSMAAGITLLGPVPKQGDRDLLDYYGIGVDEDGEVVWLYTDADGAGQDHYVRSMGDGTMMLLYDQLVRRITPGGQTIAEIGSGQMGVSHHDALPLPDGDVLFMVNESQTVDVPELGGAVTLVGDGLARVSPAGEVVWTWSTFDHLDTQRFPGELSQNRAMSGSGLDWTHGNGLALSPDGNSVLYSSRSQSWIVKISLDSGEVEWILGEDGDFALDPAGAGGGESGWFYNQHAPEMQADGTILIYDNGNERPGGESTRAVRYQLDEQAMTATEILSWEAPVFTFRMGDANLLADGNLMINVGSPEQGDAQVVAMTTAGEEIWTLTVSGTDAYRAEHLAWE